MSNTWLPGVPYTAAAEDDVTAQVNDDRESVAGDLDTVDIDTITMTRLSLTGLTGAVTPVRIVGGTASGAPTTGTFVAGDVVLTLAGQMFICTTAGSPGTWRLLGAGQIASDAGAAVTGTASATTLHSSANALTIPANPLQFDRYRYIASGNDVNVSGGSLNDTLQPTIAGNANVVTGRVAAVANSTVKKSFQVIVDYTITVAGATGTILCQPFIAWSTDNLDTPMTGFYADLRSALLTPIDLTAAVVVGLTSQHSSNSASFSTTCNNASIVRIPRGF